jgi:hypothetical protein
MKKKTNTHTESATANAIVQTNEDFKMSLIIVSVAVNVFVLTTWLVAQVSADHAAQLTTLI